MNERNAATQKSIFSGFGWSYAERMLAQIVSFVVSIILARLLGPETYGILSLVNIFIGIATAITLTGFGSALIQKKEADNLDFSSALYFSFGVSIVAYLVLFFSAPLIAGFFDAQSIAPVLRVLSLSLVLASVNTVQHAYVIRKMQFRLLFISTVCGSIFSATAGILMAYKGFGVWALVAQYLVNSIINTIVLAIISEWRPEKRFSFSRVKTIYGYGWKIIVASVVEAIYRQSRSLAIGKKYTATDLAFYDKGLQFPSLLITNIDSSIANVLMPAISSVQDEKQRVKEMVRRSVKTSSTLLFPLLIGLAVCSKPVVLILLTEKWAASIPYMQLLCLALMMKPIQTANLQGILAMGRSDTYLWLQLSQKTVGVMIIAFTVVFFDSPLVIAAGEVLSYIVFAVINAYPNKKLLNYSVKEQLNDVLPQMILAICMGIIVWVVSFTKLPSLITLVIQVLLGTVTYIGGARVLRMEPFMYLWNLIKIHFLKKKA
ncbi:MAG: lipopolysaccharide biosynthesis protein [Candidatus Pelethousia sp.]|nr:lipopolysaccharide biosynthesis protein [Candidatus Pelethousia sp.]